VLDDNAVERQFQFVPVLVCLCHPTTDRDVDSCIQSGARSVEAIGAMCGAGTGCGSCRDELRERLDRAGFGGEPDDPQGAATPRGCAGGLVALRSPAA
jgi:bacterioferritin-associated ferredoxin